MTEQINAEELFKKNFPQFVTEGGVCLSPYWDIFCAGLEAQIEKMKCCANCEHFDFTEPNYCHKGVYRERQYVCDEWKFGN